jgi:hypothetical protein
MSTRIKSQNIKHLQHPIKLTLNAQQTSQTQHANQLMKA